MRLWGSACVMGLTDPVHESMLPVLCQLLLRAPSSVQVRVTRPQAIPQNCVQAALTCPSAPLRNAPSLAHPSRQPRSSIHAHAQHTTQKPALKASPTKTTKLLTTQRGCPG